MAYYAGLDVSSEQTSVCVVDEAGAVVLERRVATEPEGIAAGLADLPEPPGRVLLETCGWPSLRHVRQSCIPHLLPVISSQISLEGHMSDAPSYTLLNRVFLLKHGNSMGSCFVIDVDDRQYIITAKHVLEDIEKDPCVMAHIQGTWAQTTVQSIAVSGDLDAIVLVAPTAVAKGDQYAQRVSLHQGQVVYFAGFPFGWTEYFTHDVNVPLPFIKKGIVSGFSGTEKHIFYIDGQSNSGFSGGPVVARDPKDRQPYIVGMVLASVMTLEPVKPEAMESERSGTIGLVRSDAGLVKALSIHPIIESIKRRPIGCLVT